MAPRPGCPAALIRPVAGTRHPILNHAHLANVITAVGCGIRPETEVVSPVADKFIVIDFPSQCVPLAVRGYRVPPDALPTGGGFVTQIKTGVATGLLANLGDNSDGRGGKRKEIGIHGKRYTRRRAHEFRPAAMKHV